MIGAQPHDLRFRRISRTPLHRKLLFSEISSVLERKQTNKTREKPDVVTKNKNISTGTQKCLTDPTFIFQPDKSSKCRPVKYRTAGNPISLTPYSWVTKRIRREWKGKVKGGKGDARTQLSCGCKVPIGIFAPRSYRVFSYTMISSLCTIRQRCVLHLWAVVAVQYDPALGCFYADTVTNQ